MPLFSTASRFPVLVVALLALSLWPVSAQAADEDYAPVDRPGPELTVPQAELEAALECVGDFSGDLQPVLFVPPTGANRVAGPVLAGGGTVSRDGQGLPATGATSHAGLVLAGLLALALGVQVLSARRFLGRLA